MSSPSPLSAQFSAVLPGLVEAIRVAGNAAAAADERLTAAAGFAESQAALWPLIEGEGEHLSGFLAFVESAVVDLSEQGGEASATADVLVELLALFEAFLQDPDDTEVVPALLTMAASTELGSPFPEETAALWRPLLRPSDPVDLSAPPAGSAPSARVGTAAEALGVCPTWAPAQAEPPPLLFDRTAFSRGTSHARPRRESAALGARPTSAGASAGQAPIPFDRSAFVRDPARSEGSHASAALVAAAPRPAAESSSAASPGEAALRSEVEDLLAILADALEETEQDFHRWIEAIAGTDEEAGSQAVTACREHLERFAEASVAVGIESFGEVCRRLAQTIGQVERPWPEALLAALGQVPARMRAYLDAPLANDGRRGLVGLLWDVPWSTAMAAADAEALIGRLRQELVDLQPEQGSQRAEVIAEEDIALRPAEDVDAPVLASFRREGPDLARRLSAVLQAPAGSIEQQGWHQAQRLAHTLKGSANICGVRAIAVLSHHLEDLLGFLAEQVVPPGPSLREVLIEATDAIEMMFDAFNGVETHPPETFLPVMQLVLDWANRIDCIGAAALAEEAEIGEQAGVATPVHAAPEPQVPAPPASGDADPADPAPEEEEPFLQVPARMIDDLLRLAGELSIALSQSEEELRQAGRTLDELTDVARFNLAHINELENLVDLRGLGIQEGERKGGRLESAEGTQLLDPLELDQYNEMYIATRRLNEGVSDAREFAQGLSESVQKLSDLRQWESQLTQEMREMALATRLVPLRSVIPRLQRAVRQTSRATGKEAELVVEGGDAQVDGEVLDRLVPAFMHLVRNAIDHGIEAPEERAAKGKARQGRLALVCRRLGNQLHLDFTDDGAGLDLERIRAKAVKQGLLDPDAQSSPKELALLTLRSGFSTRDQVTQVSGRGVGMDVVSDTVRSLNGTLSVDAAPGGGYGLHIRLPTTLLTLYCLLIRCKDQLFALQANEVRLAIPPGEGQRRYNGAGWSFHYQDAQYPLTDINRLLGIAPDAMEQDGRVVLLVDSDTGLRALLVDLLLDAREIVVKKPGRYVPELPGVFAATILGDGTVAPILELRGLMRQDLAADAFDIKTQSRDWTSLGTVLICDDSISVRRSLSQLVSDSGYRPLLARDGMEAIQVIAREMPHLLLVDLEMPKMNGLELTTHLRSQPSTKGLPIAMITSRSTEKHRRQALQAGVDRYFVKPYREEDIQDFIHHALTAGEK